MILLLILLGLQASESGARLDELARAVRGKRFAQALEMLRPLLERSPKDARLWTLNGLALAGLGRRRESLDAYRRALELQADYLPALQGKAQIEYEAGDGSAWATLTRIVSLQPGDGTAHAMLASLAYERRDCKGAIPHFEKGWQEVGWNAAGLWQYGHCLALEGRPGEAARAFEGVLRLQPENEKVRFNLVLTLYRSGQFREAIEALRILVERPAPESAALSLAAAAFKANRQTAEAVGTLRRAVELYPEEESHYLDLGALCIEHSSLALGAEILALGIRNIPRSAALHLLLGIVHAQNGDFEKAGAEFDQANRFSPIEQHGLAGLSYSSTLAGEEQLERLIPQLREQLTRNPNHAVLNYLLADGLLRKHVQPGDAEFDEAFGALERAVAAQPDFAKARTARGKLYLRLEKIPDALRELRLAVKLDPTDQFAIYQLALALNRSGRAQEAREMVEKLRRSKAEKREAEAENARLRLLKAPPDRARRGQ